MTKTALITGINGQDGSYLAELLLSKGYEVHGTVRPSSLSDSTKMSNINEIEDKINLHTCIIEDQKSITETISNICPDECYHLAANSFDDYSYDSDFAIINTNFNSTLYFLAAIKKYTPDTKFYFSGSSQLFGDPITSPQNEDTIFNPRSLYGVTKYASHLILKNFREQFGIYACTGITYNHESIRRGRQFVTRKVTSGVSDIYHGRAEKLELGDLSSSRDWGYAPDFVRAMWLMLNNPKGPTDYVISTGISHTIQDLVNVAFSAIDKNPSEYVVINKRHIRATEKLPLVGDYSKIKKDLGWSPSKNFEAMILEMTIHDLSN